MRLVLLNLISSSASNDRLARRSGTLLDQFAGPPKIHFSWPSLRGTPSSRGKSAKLAKRSTDYRGLVNKNRTSLKYDSEALNEALF